MTGPVYRRAVDLMEAQLGDELVALDPAGGECFGFNGVATFVWKALSEPRSFEQLRDALLHEYDVDRERCSGELSELLARLEAIGLVSTRK